MINVAQARADIEALPGETVATPKEQLLLMLSEVEIGQRARLALTNVRTIVNLAANAAGAAV